MVRIAVNVECEPSPTLIAEDLELAASDVGIPPETFDITEQADGCWTLDIYPTPDMELDNGVCEDIKAQLPAGGQYIVEFFADFPPKWWVYGRPV